jgi:hypothetical protein
MIRETIEIEPIGNQLRYFIFLLLMLMVNQAKAVSWIPVLSHSGEDIAWIDVDSVKKTGNVAIYRYQEMVEKRLVETPIKFDCVENTWAERFAQVNYMSNQHNKYAPDTYLDLMSQFACGKISLSEINKNSITSKPSGNADVNDAATTNQNGASRDAIKRSMEKAKINCKDIGFKEKTEDFGRCVLRLMK